MRCDCKFRFGPFYFLDSATRAGQYFQPHGCHGYTTAEAFPKPFLWAVQITEQKSSRLGSCYSEHRLEHKENAVLMLVVFLADAGGEGSLEGLEEYRRAGQVMLGLCIPSVVSKGGAVGFILSNAHCCAKWASASLTNAREVSVQSLTSLWCVPLFF